MHVYSEAIPIVCFGAYSQIIWCCTKLFLETCQFRWRNEKEILSGTDLDLQHHLVCVYLDISHGSFTGKDLQDGAVTENKYKMGPLSTDNHTIPVTEYCNDIGKTFLY